MNIGNARSKSCKIGPARIIEQIGWLPRHDRTFGANRAAHDLRIIADACERGRGTSKEV